MAEEYQAQGDYQPTTYANQEAPSDYSNGFDAKPNYSGDSYSQVMDRGFLALQQEMNGGGNFVPEDGSGITTPGGPDLAQERNASPFSAVIKSAWASLFDSKTGDLNKMGSLAGSAVLSGLGELFSGAKKDAAARAKQIADATTLNAQSNASHVANLEAARQNALTSTATAFGPTSTGPAGIIGRASFEKLDKPDWKVA